MPDNLTYRQAQFATQYVAHKGHGTKAAIAAGYSPTGAHVEASRLLRQPKIKDRIAKLTRRHEINAERVLTRLDNLSLKAEEEGNYPAAVRAEELLGKALGMWVDRSVSYSVDLSAAHLDAIRALAERRSRKSDNASGDAAKVIEGQVIEAANNEPTSDNRHYDKQTYNSSENKSVIDQRVTHVEPQYEDDEAYSGTGNADEDNI